MRKKLIFALSIIVLFLVSTFTSYALFTFHSDSKVDGSIFTDPIKENYDFTGSKYINRDTYNLYFFPQPRYASAGYLFSSYNNTNIDGFIEDKTNNKPMLSKDLILNFNPIDGNHTQQDDITNNEGLSKRSMTGYYGIYDGYFTNKDNNTKLYTPKKRISDSSLSDDILAEVGRPSADMKDSHDSIVQFAGWTMSQHVAIDLGYGGTGDYMLIDSTSPFFLIDQLIWDKSTSKPRLATEQEINDATNKIKNITGIDGSYICDGDIFLYSIFTTGKDYAKVKAKQLDCLSIEYKLNEPNNTSTKIEKNFVSEFVPINYDTGVIDEEFVGHSYVVRDIRIDNSNMNKTLWLNIMLYYYFAGNQWLRNELNSNVKILTQNNEVLANPTTTPLNSLNLIPDSSGQKSRLGDYNIYVYVLNNEFVQTSEFDKYNENFIPNALSTKKLSDIYFIDKTFFANGIREDWFVKAWIYVEEKFDFKVLGGNVSSFDFNNTSPNICQPVDDSGDNYVANNVAFNNIHKKFTYKAMQDGENNYFKNGVFTILPVSSNPTNGLITDYDIKLKEDFETTKYCSYAKSKDDPNLVGDWDYDINTPIMENGLKGKLLKIKENGYFAISCTRKIVNDGQINKKELEVSVTKIDVPIFVAIYQQASDIVYDAKGFIDFAKMQSNNKLPLYVSDISIAEKNIITGFEYLHLGDTITADTKFAVKNQDNNTYTTLASVRDIYNKLKEKGLTLYEVTTNKPVLIGGEGLMLRNRVFYIGNK